VGQKYTLTLYFSPLKQIKNILLQIKILFTGRQNKSLFVRSLLDLISDFNMAIESSDQMAENGTYAPYKQMCGYFCHRKNDQLLAVLRVFEENVGDGRYEFTYPMARVLSGNVYLGYS
jgi:hypothetical protein